MIDLRTPYFIGIAGSGMSALAQYLAMSGRDVSGSDRQFDSGTAASGILAHFETLGIRLVPQDGSGLSADNTCIIHSTAIEPDHPELSRARRLKIPVLHRSELLAEICRLKKCIAVSGTSGKSTVTAMTWHILEAAGLCPSIITGANLISLQAEGLAGNACAGTGPWLVIEADESDGTLNRYSPHTGVVLNIEKDHKELDELIPLFHEFVGNTLEALVLNKDDPHTAPFSDMGNKQTALFSSEGIFCCGRQYSLSSVKFGDWDLDFTLDKTAFHLEVPGKHNLDNALAAISVALTAGIAPEICAEGLRKYKGIERRHIRVGQEQGITVIDDFAHNPAKINAALTAVRPLLNRPPEKGRMIAIFHPHGFGPMKLLKNELTESFLDSLSQDDLLLMPEIYYAGGTADKSISSRDIINAVNSKKQIGTFFPDKAALLDGVITAAREGDVIINMGARDPGLAAFARKILAGLKGAKRPAR